MMVIAPLQWRGSNMIIELKQRKNAWVKGEDETLLEGEWGNGRKIGSASDVFALFRDNSLLIPLRQSSTCS